MWTKRFRGGGRSAVHRRLKSRGRILGKSLAEQVREAVDRYLASEDVNKALTKR
jgi:hypothetical protein